MKQVFEKGGILAQIPILLFVLIYFPGHGTDMYDHAVHVSASFYWWQGLLCIIPIVQHILFVSYQGLVNDKVQWNIMRAFFIFSFFLTIWNCMRFQ